MSKTNALVRSDPVPTALRTATVEISGGQVLRARMEVSEDGTPLRVTISRGFPDELDRADPARSCAVVVPGDQVSDLVEALRGLGADGGD